MSSSIISLSGVTGRFFLILLTSRVLPSPWTVLSSTHSFRLNISEESEDVAESSFLSVGGGDLIEESGDKSSA